MRRRGQCALSAASGECGHPPAVLSLLYLVVSLRHSGSLAVIYQLRTDMLAQPGFSTAGRTCAGDNLQSNAQACRTGNIGMEYCRWCSTPRCLTR
eukprot:COSAG02_NODE_248_length_27133_cov_45.131723_16_plen_95_part_00